MNSIPRHVDAILAEYKGVRDEILQLNDQLFTVLGSSLALNVAVLGWLFSKSNPGDFYCLPTIGIVILFVGNSILLNRNRLAHRLSLFQKYFIETRLPDILGARVYSKYRDVYQAVWLARWAERLADSGTYVLLSLSGVNLIILIWFGLSPLLGASPTKIDWGQSINFFGAAVLVAAQERFLKIMTDYRAVEAAMRQIAHASGLTSR